MTHLWICVFSVKSNGTISMCTNLEPRHGPTSCCLPGVDSTLAPSLPLGPQPASTLGLTQPQLSLPDPDKDSSIRKMGGRLCNLRSLREGLGRAILASACQLHWYLAGDQRPQLSSGKPLAHPQSRYPVSCSDSRGKGRSLA